MPVHFFTGNPGVAPWEIGRAQQEITNIAVAGHIRNPVLELGCGSGENALYLSSVGYDVLAIDIRPEKIAKATEKAIQRSSSVRFAVGDALDLAGFQTVQTVIDCGLFQLFDRTQRVQYVESLHSILQPGGTYYQLVVGDLEPTPFPRKVAKETIESAFGVGWRINFIRPTAFEMSMCAARAWLSSITRL